MDRHDTSMGVATIKKWEWLLLIAIFLLAGILGHDPWKQDETYSFGIIYHYYLTHSWLVPINAGVPFMEKPPLYYWSAAILCKLVGGLLTLPDAARLTSFFYMLVAVLFTWNASQILFRHHTQERDMGWITVALFLGSVGLIRHAHDMFTDVALLAGTSIAVYGMMMLACFENKWKRAGGWIGLGIGIAFLSKGFLLPVIMCGAGIVACLCLPLLRTRKTLGAVAIAFIAASPFLFLWPMFLYQDSPLLFKQWFWDNNIGRFLGFSVDKLGADNKPFYILYTAIWFAFPAFGLACVAAVRGRGQWRAPEYLVPLSICAAGLLLLLMSASSRALYLLPLLPAFALAGAEGLSALASRFRAVWNSLVRIVFSIGMLAVWFIWWSLLHTADTQPIPQASATFGKWLPVGFIPDHCPLWNILLASVITALWLMSLRLDKRMALNTAYIWLAGVAVLWGTSHTLLLPWIDETKSYRPVITELSEFIDRSAYAKSCVSRFKLGESISPMFEYFGGKHPQETTQNPNKGTCKLVLTSTAKTAPPSLDAHWKLMWRGSRLLDTKDEELRLYARRK